MIFTKQRGTVDLIEDEARYFTKLEETLRFLAKLYNIDEIRTPMFEATNLFTKAVGETSDIVQKEFYNFLDKGNREIALRPEGTAGTIRAIVEEKMLLKSNYPVRVFYLGSMFRYERPQSGRQRQFNQFGVEIVGDIKLSDEIECLNLAQSILDAINVKNYTLYVNNLGSVASRNKWIDALKKYFNNFKNELSQDSINRLEKNPLRILDDKIDGQKDFVKKAPKLKQFLTNEENVYFEQFIKILDQMNIKYEVNENLVRGLDYYTGIVFEYVSKSDKLKGQSTLIGGGKYDGLVEATGGPNVPGVGFGAGMERLIIAIKEENDKFLEPKTVDFVFAPLDQKCLNLSLLINAIIRAKCFSVGMLHNNFKLDKHFKYAEKLNARYVIILGAKELEEGTLIIKDQKTKQEIKQEIKTIDQWLEGIKR